MSSDDRKPTSGVVANPTDIPLPTLGPASTGNLITDSFRSAFNIAEVPCARSSLLSGIASGVGIGFVRGMSASAFVAGNWAFGTFAVISTASWLMCTGKLERQHQLTRQTIEALPKQLRLKDEKPDSA
ncbi:hypothetical protein MKEN_00924000 [Mycena kentingensis (nom. inval.)]|nr:hypothetical protein MKEN_00924000 [Mycena kentingensis (nom. inval.)]